MGLFSAKKITHVGTTVNRVVPDESIPNALRAGLLKALFDPAGQGDIPMSVADELMSSIAVKGERAYKYAKQHYTFGLPSGKAYTAIEGEPEIQAVLDAVEGASVLIDYYRFGPPNYMHHAWMQLIALHGYDPVTNELGPLSVLKDTPVYMTEMGIVIPAAMQTQIRPGGMDQWGTSTKIGKVFDKPALTGLLAEMTEHVPVAVTTDHPTPFAFARYVWQAEADLEVQEGILYIELAYLDEEKDFFHVKYTVGAVTKYWSYEHKLGTYSTLDGLFDDPPVTTGTYFPFVYFRFNKINDAADDQAAHYASSVKLTKHLGINYAQLADDIDANPDIADVEQAMLIFAVPAVSANKQETRYLFDYFNKMYLAGDQQYTTIERARLDAFYEQISPDVFLRSIVIKDARFKMVLSHNGITRKRIAGWLGPKGTCTSHTYQIVAQTLDMVVYGDTDSVIQVPLMASVHAYRKQVSASIFEEILVYNLEMKYNVFEGYFSTASDDAPILLIPLDHSITTLYSAPDREKLYARSMHFVFNSRIIETVKWYQSLFFKFVMIVVSIFILIWTSGASIQQFAALIAAGQFVAAIVMVAMGLAYSMVVSYIFKLVVKAVGVELAFLIAIIAMMYGMYEMNYGGGVPGLPFGQDLIKLATGLGSAIQETVGDMYAALQTDWTSFQTAAEEQNKLLKEAQALLEGNSPLSPMIFFGETPDEYYNRTIHSGNIGIIGIDAIHSYVDASLALPKFSHLGGI